MVGTIITARHGKPDLSREVKITWREYGEWWKQYDLAGLIPSERPPQSLVDLAKECDFVITSTLPRAIETADHVTGGTREVPQDVVYVEAPLPPPPIPFVRLRPGVWGVISRTVWILGYAPKGFDSHWKTWKRVAKIVDNLTEIAEQGNVMLCAHGYLNWMISRRLTKATAYEMVDREGGDNHWSWRKFDIPAK